jgi:hypothetical protein
MCFLARIARITRIGFFLFFPFESGHPSSPTATPRQVRIPKGINFFEKRRRTVQYLPLYLDAFSKVDQEGILCFLTRISRMYFLTIKSKGHSAKSLMAISNRNCHLSFNRAESSRLRLQLRRAKESSISTGSGQEDR